MILTSGLRGWRSWPRPLAPPLLRSQSRTRELCSYSRWGSRDLVASCLRNYCVSDIEFSPAGFRRLDLPSRGRLGRAEAESLCGLEGGTGSHTSHHHPPLWPTFSITSYCLLYWKKNKRGSKGLGRRQNCGHFQVSPLVTDSQEVNPWPHSLACAFSLQYSLPIPAPALPVSNVRY